MTEKLTRNSTKNKKYSDEEVLQGCLEEFEIKNIKRHIKEFKISEALILLPYLLACFEDLNLIHIERYKNLDLFEEYVKEVYKDRPVYINNVLFKIREHVKDLEFVLIQKDIVSKDYLNLFWIICKQNRVIEAIERIKKFEDEPKQIGLPIGALHSVAQIIKARLWPGLTLLNYKEILTFGQFDVLTRLYTDIEKMDMLNQRTVLIYSIGSCFGDSKNKAPDFENVLFGLDKGENATKQIENNKIQKRKAFFKERWNDPSFVIEQCKKRGSLPSNYYTDKELHDLKLAGYEF